MAACVNYSAMNTPRAERPCPPRSPILYYRATVKSPCSEPYGSGSCSGWMSPAYSTSGTETSTREGRGDPAFPDALPRSNAHESPARPVLSIDKIQTRLKFLEDSNTVMQTRNQNLIVENKALRSRLDEEVGKGVELEGKVNALQQELLARATEGGRDLEERRTTTNRKDKTDRPVQVWAVCRACHEKLEDCAELRASLTISKSELDVLERDMQTLRDAVIAREDEWDKARERERTYRQQLTRLTAEAITARHLSESRLDELRDALDALTDKETQLKSVHKEMQRANKMIVKLSRRLRDFEERTGDALNSEISEKDQRFIEEIVRRTSSVKGKRKVKSRLESGKSLLSGAQQDGPAGNKSPRHEGDLSGLSGSPPDSPR